MPHGITEKRKSPQQPSQISQWNHHKDNQSIADFTIDFTIDKKPQAICAHSYHAKVNTSGGEFSGAVRCGRALPEVPQELLELMPLAQQAAGAVPQRMDQSIGDGGVGMMLKDFYVVFFFENGRQV